MALVSSPDFASTVADFRKAQAAWVQAKRVADLDEQLWKNDAIAKRDLEQAQTDAVAAGADRDAALQQLRALGVDDASIAALRDNKDVPTMQAAIRAPIDGTVVERLINPGQLLQAGTTPTYTIANLATMWVQTSVFESDLSAVQVGDRAEVTTPASPCGVHRGARGSEHEGDAGPRGGAEHAAVAQEGHVRAGRDSRVARTERTAHPGDVGAARR